MITPIVFFFAIILYRIVAAVAGEHDTAWLNFSPLAAIALCGPLIFPRRVAFVLPLAILLVSDMILNAYFGFALVTGEMVARYGVLALIALAGLRLASRQGLGAFLPTSIACSTGFYLITNTVSWLSEPLYAKSLAGWMQALSIGLPGFPPTVWFYRNSLISDFCFTAVMLGCIVMTRRLRAEAGALGGSRKLPS
ncbi:MAG TPA: DUF6580 family putative transport protein [Luteolibacter sp.]|nr:DUF6580 family putative transport protein [Luteolibacter sp.]